MLGATTLALVGLQGVPFASADSTQVIRSYADFGSNLAVAGIFAQSCDPATAGEGSEFPSPISEKGPTPVPVGARTWGYRTTTPQAVGPSWLVDSMAGITTDHMQVYSDSGTATGAASAHLADGTTGDDWFGVSPLSLSAGSWQTVQGAGSTSYTWRGVHWDGSVVGTFTGSINDLLGHLGLDDATGSVGLGFGCTTGQTVHFDDVEFGTADSVGTFDFEGGLTTTTGAAARRVVTAGRSPRLTATESIDGQHLEGGRIALQRRAFGTSNWRTVVTLPATPDGAGTFSTRVYLAKPMRKTSYRWRCPSTAANDGSTSRVLTIKVHTAVRAHAPAKVALGSKVHVRGSTLPKNPGQRITLWRGSHLLDATKVGRRGTFSLATRAHFRGRLNLVVKIGTSPGNLRGSKTLVVKVR